MDPSSDKLFPNAGAYEQGQAFELESFAADKGRDLCQESPPWRSRSKTFSWWKACLVSGLFTLFIVAGLIIDKVPDSIRLQTSQSSTNAVDSSGHIEAVFESQSQAQSCAESQMEVRKEWRALTSAERHAYVHAVQCLTSTPSKLFGNGSLYDDFVWTHNKYAHASHNAAPFLPFHRRFIRKYELTLREVCGFTGTLPYWNWSLDSDDLRAAPVWSAEDGFGGDGTGEVIGEGLEFGRCVKEGPFADVQLMFRGSRYEPHCLSRAFRDDISASSMNETGVQKILSRPDYPTFYLLLESSLHDVLPHTVRGDFRLFTAPNDPVFYLHHTQLDRLWWLWQQQDPEVRLKDYREWEGFSDDEDEDSKNEHTGHDESDPHMYEEQAPPMTFGLTDKITLGELDPVTVTVADIMDTSAEPYCYVYQ